MLRFSPVMLGKECQQKIEGFRKALELTKQHDLSPEELFLLAQDHYAEWLTNEGKWRDEGDFPYPKCAECAHVIDNLPPRLYCTAPQLDDAIESPEGVICECNAVRSFKTGCGNEGRWFHRRHECHYSYISEDWATAGDGD